MGQIVYKDEFTDHYGANVGPIWEILKSEPFILKPLTLDSHE